MALLTIGTVLGVSQEPWLGPFKLQGKCDTTRCCCATGQVVGTHQGQYLILTSGASPNCGSAWVAVVSYPIGNSFTLTSYYGETITVAVTSDGKTLTISNSPATYCSDVGDANPTSKSNSIRLINTSS
jgi:hypothetical protein